MKKERWYPSLTELSDGRYVAISGNDTTNTHWADTPEVYDPATNTWTLLPGISTPQVHETEYPFSYLIPNGKIFTIGPAEDNSFMLDANAQTWVATGGASGVKNGSSVMYLPGKVLYSGGGANVDAAGPSAKTARVIDLTATTPTWQAVPAMNSARVYHTLTMLADGTVLAVGGAANTDQHIITTGELSMEIWNPTTQVWTAGPSMTSSRNYHSTALMMPDGRVLVAGGGHPFGTSDAGQYSAQYYSPAYLSNGPRPTITSASPGGTYGSSISVSTPDAASIRSVNLVSLGADTHQTDMNQHFVPLSFAATANGLTVQTPASAALAPPGYYMLFILNDKGVPSVASMVQLSANPTVPAAPAAVTATPADHAARVNWTAPNAGGSPLLSYTVTPYLGAAAQPATTVTGNPPATNVTVPNLTNGQSYTFTVTATNSIGTSPPSAPSGPVTPSASPPPTFVQQGSTQGAGTNTRTVVLPSNLVGDDRLVVSVGTWSAGGAVTNAVTDSAGDVFTEVAHWKGSDNAELSVWAAPVTAGAGLKPVITATASGAADIGVNALEYAGLSTVADASIVDKLATATGTTTAAATVSSGATAATTATTGLAVGFYADSGFNHAVTGASGWSVRGNMSPNGNMDLLTEDQLVPAGSTPNASVGAGASTIWLLGTVVFKSGSTAPPTAPNAPTGVFATAGNQSATVTWTAPLTGGSPITSYTVTPYIGAVAQTPVTVATTTAAFAGLVNGTAYTFAVTATNAVGTSPPSAPSVAVTPTNSPPPAFVQKVSAQTANKTSFAVTMPAAAAANNRLIVEVGSWGGGSPNVTSMTDNAGDTFTLLATSTASDQTRLTVWTAVVATGGTIPVITATISSTGEIGVAALEYSGLSLAPGAAAVDKLVGATGNTAGAGTVSSGATAALTGDGLAIGFYADSGFGATLGADAAFTSRVNLSPNGNMDLLVEDRSAAIGTTVASTASTGPSTPWLMTTIVFRRG